MKLWYLDGSELFELNIAFLNNEASDILHKMQKNTKIIVWKSLQKYKLFLLLNATYFFKYKLIYNLYILIADQVNRFECKST